VRGKRDQNFIAVVGGSKKKNKRPMRGVVNGVVKGRERHSDAGFHPKEKKKK